MQDNDQLHAATNSPRGPDPLEAEQAPERVSMFWMGEEEFCTCRESNTIPRLRSPQSRRLFDSQIGRYDATVSTELQS